MGVAGVKNAYRFSGVAVLKSDWSTGKVGATMCQSLRHKARDAFGPE